MEISIILTGDMYNPRTKGEIKKLLSGLQFTELGPGSTFTGFIVDNCTQQELESRLCKYTNKKGFTIDCDPS